MCYKCVGLAKHGDDAYYKNPENGRLRPEWIHPMTLSKFPPNGTKAAKVATRVISILEKKAKRKDDAPMPSAEEVADMMSGSSAAKRGTMANVVSLRSGNHKQSKYHRRQLYCHSKALSIACVGTPFLALAVDRDKCNTLIPDLLQVWLDFCASFLDIEAYQPKGPAMNKAKKDLVQRVADLKISSRM